MTSIGARLRRQLCSWSREAATREACGFLLGTVRGTRIDVSAVHLASNLAEGEDRFELDPGEIVRADVDARARGLALVGFWHSHPRSDALPSADDARGAWPGCVTLIVGLRDIPVVRAWRPAPGGFVEDALVAPDDLHDLRIGPQSARGGTSPNQVESSEPGSSA